MPSDVVTQVPIADGLFTWPSDEPRLIASRFPKSGVVTFPKQDHCPKTSSDIVEEVLLPSRGELWTWTIQRFPPKSPPYLIETDVESFVPYGVGYVDLGEVLVRGRLTVADPERLRIGMPMKLVVVPLTTDDQGREVLIYAFAPVDEEDLS